jgi:hypothetical protein
MMSSGLLFVGTARPLEWVTFDLTAEPRPDTLKTVARTTSVSCSVRRKSLLGFVAIYADQLGGVSFSADIARELAKELNDAADAADVLQRQAQEGANG